MNLKFQSHINLTKQKEHEVIAGSGICINDGTEILYIAGTISIISASIPHEVNTRDDGLYIFAKFISALC